MQCCSVVVSQTENSGQGRFCQYLARLRRRRTSYYLLADRLTKSMGAEGREERSGRRHETMVLHVAMLELIVILGNKDGTSHRSDSPWGIVSERTRKKSFEDTIIVVFIM